jgi:Kef-type K+ transport system membrane component KefB
MNQAKNLFSLYSPRWKYLLFFFFLFSGLLWASGDGEHGGDVITSVGIAILGATVVAFFGHLLKQPLLLAYIAAGIIIGPKIGLGFIKDEGTIETISHFGLILLLFLIGLEIDIKKLKSSGTSLILSGALQFPISVALGLGFFYAFGIQFRAWAI